jgi:hypothetical protein
MRRLAITLTMTATILCAGLLAWKAEATTWAGAKQLRNAAETVNPVDKAACRGWGEHCPPGYIWNGFRCVPC